MMMEAEQNTSQFHFLTQLNFFTPPFPYIVNVFLFNIMVIYFKSFPKKKEKALEHNTKRINGNHFQLAKRTTKNGQGRSCCIACYADDNLELCKGGHMQKIPLTVK
jgi:hypothetical protein